jgi:hypothetical protein
MAKSVPFQTAPEVQLTSGSEVQFSGGQVKPSEDVVSGEIKKQGQALLNAGQVLNKLDDEINDAESKMLYNELHSEVQNVVTNYSNLKGADAVKVTNKDTGATSYDDSNTLIQQILDNKGKQARNGMVKFMVEKMASVTVKDAQNKMLSHSLTQQNKYNLSETETKRDTHKVNAQINYKNFAEPGGAFQTEFNAGLNMIDEIATLKGWNTDPNAIGPDGKKMGISSNYLNAINEYMVEVAEDALDKFKEDEDAQGNKNFLKFLNELVDKKVVEKYEVSSEKNHTAIKNEKVVDAILNNNGNQNDGNYINVVNKTLSLSSNHSYEDGVGNTVNDGLNSGENDTTNKKQTENIELLEQKRSQSLFFNLDSPKIGTLIPQHEPTHMFAIEQIGVAKADSLYLKAQREYELPEFENKFSDTKAGRRKYAIAKKKFEEEFLKNPENENVIKAAILDKYNELIVNEHENKFNRFYGATKDTYPNAPKKEDFGSGASGSKKYREAKKEFFSNPENIVKVNPGVDAENLETMTGEKKYQGRWGSEQAKIEKEEKFQNHQDKVANDLQIIKNGVDYNAIIEEPKVNFITGLRPLNDLKKEIKATITNKEEQEVALKDLEVKYNKIAEEKTAIYNEKRDAAIKIAFAEPNGWKNLAANGIKIDNFTEEDQTIFKEGPPEESDLDTQIKLIDNPAEVRDNLNAHRHRLNPNTYLQLERYSQDLKNENKYVEATGDKNMLKNTLNKNDMGDLHTSENKKKKAKYVAINDAWINEINARQIAKGNVKLTRGEKQDALNAVLLDTVNIDRFFGDTKNENIYFVDQDDLQDVYVDVPFDGQNERVFISKIPAQPGNNVLKLIKASLRLANEPVTQQNIAEYWLISGKAENEKQARENISNYYMDK